jgi:hypothetical protein
MKKQMCLNALDMNRVGGSPGVWLHPEDQTERYNHLGLLDRTGEITEAGPVRLAIHPDIFGVYDVYGGNPDAAFRNAVEFLINDAFLLVTAIDRL